MNATLVSSFKSGKGEIGRLKEGQQSRPIPDRCTGVEYNVFSDKQATIMELYVDGHVKIRAYPNKS